MTVSCRILCNDEHHLLTLQDDGTITIDPEAHDQELEQGLVELGAPEPDCFRMARHIRNQPLDIVECVMNVDLETGEIIDRRWRIPPGGWEDSQGIGDYLELWIALDFLRHVLWILDDPTERQLLTEAIEYAQSVEPYSGLRSYGLSGEKLRLYSHVEAIGNKYSGRHEETLGIKPQTALWMVATAVRNAVHDAFTHFAQFTRQRIHESAQRAAMAAGFMTTPEGRDFAMPRGERYDAFFASHTEATAAFTKERQWQLKHLAKVLTDLKAGKKVYPHWEPR